jgi:hypothetical protein
MVALRLLAMDDISFRSWGCRPAGECGDVWVFFSEVGLFPEFLKHFYHASSQDLVSIPYSENFF